MQPENFPQLRSDEELQQTMLAELKPHNAPIPLAEYDEAWPAAFAREAERLRTVLGSRALQIEHVGSTSVPGLCAKPVIDIVVVVEDSSDEASFVPLLEAAGYTLRIREPDWFEHRLFKGPDIDINLHVFSEGASEVEKMLRFRDWLRSHPEDRERYASEKRRLAQKTWKHVQHYADAKTGVIEEILTKAGWV